uniref:Uncharacterized protein n=1 Tax=Arundo donax TaxID=35708 RepID=A0A0A9GGB3_ARUDO
MASPVHVSLAVLLVGDRVPRAPPFLAVGPAAPSRLQIRAAGVAQLERAPSQCACAEVGRRVGGRCEAPPDGDEEAVRNGAVGSQVFVDQGLVL